MEILTSGKYSDFKVILSDKTYNLHKAYLSKCEYFSTYFESNMYKDNIEFGYSSKSFDIFLEYLYDDNKELSLEYLHSLLEMASYFRFQSLHDRCVASMDKVTPEGFTELLTIHPDFVNNMKDISFANKCNQAPEAILSKFGNICDLPTLKKILTCLEGTSIYPIIKAVHGHKYEPELLEHIDNITFSITAEDYDKLTEEFPSLLSLSCVVKSVKSLISNSGSKVLSCFMINPDYIDDLKFNQIIDLGQTLMTITLDNYGFICFDAFSFLGSNLSYIAVEETGICISSQNNKFRFNPYLTINRKYKITVCYRK